MREELSIDEVIEAALDPGKAQWEELYALLQSNHSFASLLRFILRQAEGEMNSLLNCEETENATYKNRFKALTDLVAKIKAGLEIGRDSVLPEEKEDV